MASLNVFTEREIKELEAFAKMLDEFIANNEKLLAQLEEMKNAHTKAGWDDTGGLP
jgi:hypothetical protein